MPETDQTVLATDDMRLHEPFMTAAIEAARRGLLAGEPPVGACLVVEGEIVATLNNAVISELDITAHAEMRVIRAACQTLRRLNLSGSRLYVTVEPCLMCQSACHYAGIDEVVYGASIADMNAVTGNELSQVSNVADSTLLIGGCMGTECRALINQWAKQIPPQR
ncbi:MAG: nucleoside deaminase [Gammaproteobacteria bacterium]|jgi:tRNA(Arg) A34 adenosine deaminase TadA|nr:nucleoside deaminase [Gammaproteobacteria bacterium]